jgi:hypothetical protein
MSCRTTRSGTMTRLQRDDGNAWITVLYRSGLTGQHEEWNAVASGLPDR